MHLSNKERESGIDKNLLWLVSIQKVQSKLYFVGGVEGNKEISGFAKHSHVFRGRGKHKIWGLIWSKGHDSNEGTQDAHSSPTFLGILT